MISADSEFFKLMRSRDHDLFGQPQPSTEKTEKGCPHDCGLCPNHRSAACVINIDLTNRCNLNCPICFANANTRGKTYELNWKQIQNMIELTITNSDPKPLSIQFSGGEPSIHPNFLDAVELAKNKGILDVQVATNGLKFAEDIEFARRCREAGLDVLYLQFDGISDDIYLKTRGRPLCENKIQVIENCRKTGLKVVLVPTLVNNFNNHQVGDILNFAAQNADVVTGISFQPVAFTGRIDENKRKQQRYTLADMTRDIQKQTGALDMYRDWFPFSAVSPISELIELLTGKRSTYFSCHPDCGVASYVLVDKETKEIIPLSSFLDIDGLIEEVKKKIKEIKKPPQEWSGLFKTFSKYFHPEKAPKNLSFEDLKDFLIRLISGIDLQKRASSQEGKIYHQIGNFHAMLVASMHFQDHYNFDLKRAKRCVVHYAAPNGKFYPFCTWNSGPCHRKNEKLLNSE